MSFRRCWNARAPNGTATEILMDPLWSKVSALVASKTGLYFPPGRNCDLERALGSAAGELGMADAATYAESLLSEESSHDNLQVLVRHLTVGETYFWRDGSVFDALSRSVLPELIQRRSQQRRLNVWSAACCTGEEAYSLAILLRQCVPAWQDWRISILGTDINEAFVRRAAAGVYGEWSFRGVPPAFKHRYFTTAANGRYAILPQIRDMVRFAPHNLVVDTSTILDDGPMDLILCRNVLMYLTPAQARKVILNMENALAEQSWLIVGASECSHALFPAFTSVSFPGAIFYRKEPRASNVQVVLEPADVGSQHRASAVISKPPPPRAVSDRPLIADTEQSYAKAARLYRQQRYADAVNTLTGAARPAAADAPTCSLLARALANIGQLDAALEWCKRWIAVDVLNGEAHYTRALILQELGRAEDARRSLKQVIYLDPGFTLAYIGLGTLARAEGQEEQAVKHFSNALASLRGAAPDDVPHEADGLTARQVQAILMSLLAAEPAT